MVWIIALLCIGAVGVAGYYRGPICAGFSCLGLLLGIVLAKPLSPLTRPALPLLGLHYPIWGLFVPGALAFALIVIIFKIAGNTLHHKMSMHFKYQRDEPLFYRWERLYTRLGLCVGLINGVIYFFILMLPVYVVGYFTADVDAADLPLSARIANSLRPSLHSSGLDRVVAAYDPCPEALYQTADVAALVHQNPLLLNRLTHYPALLSFSQTPQIQGLLSDVQLQQMIQSQAKIMDIVKYPKVDALVTNADFALQVRGVLGNDLADLEQYLKTGKSDKYDSDKLLGIWDIDVHATLAQERRQHLDMNRNQIAALHTGLVPLITGLSLTFTTDNQLILKKQNPNSALPTAVGQGTWKKSDSAYDVTLADNKPDDIQVTPAGDGTLQFQRNGHILIFNKEM